MATDTQGSVARSYPTQQILYLRKDFTFLSANGPTTALAVDNIVIGTVPAGALICKAISGVNVDVAFNAGTNNLIDIGSAATRNLLSSGASLASIAFVALAATIIETFTVDTVLAFKLNTTGTSATTGKGSVIIAYTLPDQSMA